MLAAPVGGVSAPLPSYDELRASFRWQLPAVVNIGVEVADRQPPAAPAILVTDGREITRTVTFGELTEASNRLANALAAKGVAAGDRVALILSQRPETVIAHVAIYKLGAIVVPLSAAFGSDALGVRLRGSEPRAIIAERASLERAAELGFDGISIDVDHDLDALLAAASPDFTAAATTPDTPALLVYTSGTTGLAEGRAPRPPRAGRPPARLRALARLLPAAGRPDLDAGRLGLDRRPLRRRHAGPRARRPRRRVPHAAVRSRGRVRRHRPRRHPQRLHARDGAADDAAQRRRAGDAADDRERGRDGRRGDGGVVPRAVRRAAERVLRPDRGEPADRQLRRLARAAGLDGPGVSGARAAARRR